MTLVIFPSAHFPQRCIPAQTHPPTRRCINRNEHFMLRGTAHRYRSTHTPLPRPKTISQHRAGILVTPPTCNRQQSHLHRRHRRLHDLLGVPRHRLASPERPPGRPALQRRRANPSSYHPLRAAPPSSAGLSPQALLPRSRVSIRPSFRFRTGTRFRGRRPRKRSCRSCSDFRPVNLGHVLVVVIINGKVRFRVLLLLVLLVLPLSRRRGKGGLRRPLGGCRFRCLRASPPAGLSQLALKPLPQDGLPLALRRCRCRQLSPPGGRLSWCCRRPRSRRNLAPAAATSFVC